MAYSNQRKQEAITVVDPVCRCVCMCVSACVCECVCECRRGGGGYTTIHFLSSANTRFALQGVGEEL